MEARNYGCGKDGWDPYDRPMNINGEQDKNISM